MELDDDKPYTVATSHLIMSDRQRGGDESSQEQKSEGYGQFQHSRRRNITSSNTVKTYINATKLLEDINVTF